ncbi:hypothetical protein WJX77_003560 [Trebouxia sp. C0004]
MVGGRVIEVTSAGDWDKRHAEAKSARKAILVDFTAAWCGPCKMVAPHFEQLSTTYPNVIFLKVDVDKNSDVAQQCQVRAMPTFHVYSGGQKVEEIVGANLNALKAACEKYDKASSTFQGAGHTLSGSGGGSAPSPRQAAPAKQASTGIDESQPATTLQIRLADGSKLTGRFNLTQTVQDVKKFIDASSSQGGNYKLTTSYPRKELTDLFQTLQAADVADTVLTVSKA